MSRFAPVHRFGATLLIAAMLSACSTEAPATEATRPSTLPSTVAAAPTPAPTPTEAVFTFPEGSRIIGVDVGGQTTEAAVKLVGAELRSRQAMIPIKAPASIARPVPVIKPATVRRDPDAQQLVADAESRSKNGQPVEIDWAPELDEAKLRAELESIAPAFRQESVSDVLTDTESLTGTFTFRYQPGIELDIDATAALLTPLLTDPTAAMTETAIINSTEPERDMAQLEAVLREHLKYWKNGIGAIYVNDLETGQTLGINQDSVFSGASVMKVPIMIYVYSKLGQLNEKQHEWMEGMLIDSDNIDANSLLAAAAGGQGTEIALKGVNEMSEMLQGLGLKHTYQLIPYESGEWLIQQSKLPKGGPVREGAAPYTAADRYLRTTPREMGELFTMLAQCADGTGKLLETYSETLSEELCQEMMGWLERPHDEERMVAGIPKGVKVAHKGGWIDDMQSDVGIVSSPNGRYVAAIYVWRENGYATNIHASPSPYLGDFSHTIYTFFNPEPVDE